MHMRNRLVKTRPFSNTDRKSVFAIHDENDNPVPIVSTRESAPVSLLSARSTPTKLTRKPSHDAYSTPRSTLAHASQGVINAAAAFAMPRASPSMNGNISKTLSPSASPRSPPSHNLGRMNSTIRPVPSFDERDRTSDDSSAEGTPSLSNSRNSALSSSVNSTASMSSVSQSINPPQSTIQDVKSIKPGSVLRLKSSMSQLSHQDGPTPTLEVPRSLGITARPSFEIPQRESSLGGMSSQTTADPPPGGGAGVDENASPQPGWDSSVGKAGLGKTGRVINRLVSDNEALKRDIQIERLKADEARQEARLLEDKLERVIADYENRLREADITKVFLARKERQVESLQEAVKLEKKRTADALAREEEMRTTLKNVQEETTKKVVEATNKADLYEGRYNAISSHWRDQGLEVEKKVAKTKKEIEKLKNERKKDDDKINTLRDLCVQQDGNIRELTQQKEDIGRQFEAYKAEQEEALRAIKTKAKQREEEQEDTIRQAKEVLDKLKWALNVKDKIEWAQ